MSGMSPMMAAMRAMRADPSVVDQKVSRRTLRRVGELPAGQARLLRRGFLPGHAG